MDGAAASPEGTPGTGGHRGVLYPLRLPSFRRLPAPPPVADLVRWFWVPEWDLPEGRVSRQHLIAFPALNLVVEHGDLAPAGTVGLAGPTTRASSRDLTGRGAAVGALLRPAAVPLFTEDPHVLADQYLELDLDDLRVPVVAALWGQGSDQDSDQGSDRGSDLERHGRVVGTFATWLAAHAPPLSEEASTANRLADAIDLDSGVLSVQDAADRVGISTRTAQRLARRYLGVSPGASIRRRRLQETAERLRLDSALDLATLAAELGYSDHAHLSRDFRSVLGVTPSSYRRDAST